MRSLPKAGNRCNGTECASFVDPHTHESRHSLGERECPEAISEFGARGHRCRSGATIVEYRSAPGPLDASRAPSGIDREHLVAEILDEDTRIAENDDLGRRSQERRREVAVDALREVPPRP